MGQQDRRAYARIAFPSRVTVEYAGGTETLAARDISKGGIFLYATHPPVGVGETLRVMLPNPQDGSLLTLEGEVVRVVEAPASQGGGVLGFALQWSVSSSKGERELELLLAQLLQSTGGGKRADARVAALLRVVCTTPKELRAVVRDIGKGGLKLEADRPLAADDVVEVELVNPEGKTFAVRGRVRRIEPPARGRTHGDVAVQFDPLSEAQRAQLQALLGKLVSKKR